MEREAVLWKSVADWAKRRPAALAVADWLGRGRGRMRVLDRVTSHCRPSAKPNLSRWQQSHLAATWIGHATVLIRIGEMTILTDPVLGRRVGLGLGLATGGPARLVAPSLRLRELPKIDLILLSHAHFDHLDRPTLSRLPKSTPVVTAGRTRDLVSDLGFDNVTELCWGQSRRLQQLRITACEVRHWGARTFSDGHRHACAYLLEACNRRVLFGGDSAYGRHFANLARVDLAILGIGAYNPHLAGHANPEQAWRMANDARADFVIPIHHSTFRLSREAIDEPLGRFVETAGRSADRIVARRLGEVWTPN